MPKYTWYKKQENSKIESNPITHLLDKLKSDLENQTDSLLEASYEIIPVTLDDERVIIRYVFSLKAPYIGYTMRSILAIDSPPNFTHFPINLKCRLSEGWYDWEKPISNIDDLDKAFSQFVESKEVRDFILLLLDFSKIELDKRLNGKNC